MWDADVEKESRLALGRSNLYLKLLFQSRPFHSLSKEGHAEDVMPPR